jgi:cytochrome c5
VFGKSVDYKNNNDTTIVSDSLLVKIDSAIIIQQNLTDGKNIYNKKCGKCHELHETDEYSQKEWKKILKVMKEKAELTTEQHSLVLGYLYSKSKK